MRLERSATAISWIPSEAVTGIVYKVPFSVGMASYDDPPPDHINDIPEFVAAGRCRFANRLHAWVEIENGRIIGFGQEGAGQLGSTTLRLGRAMTFAAVAFADRQSAEQVGDDAVRFVQTAGGRTGVPAPRRVNHPPYVQFSAPAAWTTLTLTVRVDGSTETTLEGASPFPRHWVYDGDGRLLSKSSLVDYRTWSVKAFGRRTPWGDEDSPALVHEVETALEREVSRRIMTTGKRPRIRRLAIGDLLTEQGQEGAELYVLLDGVLSVDVDGDVVAEVGPGAVLGERALLEGGRRSSTLRAVTRCAVAVAQRDSVDEGVLREVAEGHRREKD